MRLCDAAPPGAPLHRPGRISWPAAAMPDSIVHREPVPHRGQRTRSLRTAWQAGRRVRAWRGLSLYIHVLALVALQVLDRKQRAGPALVLDRGDGR